MKQKACSKTANQRQATTCSDVSVKKSRRISNWRRGSAALKRWRRAREMQICLGITSRMGSKLNVGAGAHGA